MIWSTEGDRIIQEQLVGGQGCFYIRILKV